MHCFVILFTMTAASWCIPRVPLTAPRTDLRIDKSIAPAALKIVNLRVDGFNTKRILAGIDERHRYACSTVADYGIRRIAKLDAPGAAVPRPQQLYARVPLLRQRPLIIMHFHVNRDGDASRRLNHGFGAKGTH